MEDNKIKAMNHTIQTTQGDFNPLIEYAKLYRYHLASAALVALALMVGTIAYSIAEIHVDPFTKKKKIVLISNEF